ncbi:putative O-glycosylation ligase, exosortase A system-associated [Candidatus Contendibacter odensensis]|uniref:O-glycosylation ligase, exosortase A system-associated n=1 Tax=Candidatus Contendobacter odensis Run_B_J11 TaxID=1400861 RepID=A0A7U7G7F6_9GAMM|nr:putative O-glycosylation ligase, exosortase A system-associated [Candidatus Contendobacter odensis]CDH43076.1 conserved membrane hypothetical protein [Candidatus Contendobacter odensis Run_B_J11]
MPLRDITVLIIAIVGCIWALKRPYVGILTWIWISLMNPHRLGWGFAYDLPFAQMAALATFTGMIFSRDRLRFPVVAPSMILIFFITWMGATTLAAILPAESMEMYVKILKILVMTLVAMAIIRTREQINLLVWIVVLSLGYFGTKGGIFTILSGGAYRVWGPPSSYIEGNNELALALITTIPLMYYLACQDNRQWFGKYSTWVRRGLYAMMALSAFSALGSHSRGALLAMIAMTLMLWWRSKNKAVLGVALLMVLPLMMLFMPTEWFSRMETIGSYQEDASAMGRINAWTMAINIAKDRFFGAGFITESDLIYNIYAPNPSLRLVAHSIYFQVLGSHGFIGLSLFLLFWWFTFRTARSAGSLSLGEPSLQWIGELSRMIRVGLIGYFVGGAFLNLAYFDLPYYMMVVIVAAQRLAMETKTQQPTTGFSRIVRNPLMTSRPVRTPIALPPK